MSQKDRSISREKKTFNCMLQIYCNYHHKEEKTLCCSCQELLAYTTQRIEKCPLGEKKSTCARCEIHCFKQDMREAVREVMIFSGPKMIWTHPVLAFFHFIKL
jgi:hypothetical protein